MCLVLEEFVRLLHHCGMSLTELDICNGRGATVNEIMAQGEGCRGGWGSRVGGCQWAAWLSGWVVVGWDGRFHCWLPLLRWLADTRTLVSSSPR